MDNMPEDENGFMQQEPQRKGNVLQIWGNPQSMNLNSMVLTNILQSPYFKTELSELNSYLEVIDEIYYKVTHMEPWERGSRRTNGLTGMCGGVRGVGEGGIVSTPYCLLYKLFTLKLTRKQLHGMLDHSDSPYIRALGFMYIRYCLNPKELWSWYENYLDDEEELDIKAGGGCMMSIGHMLQQWLTKLDWCGTLFPRIPVPVQKEIEQKMRERNYQKAIQSQATAGTSGFSAKEERETFSRESGGSRVDRQRDGVREDAPRGSSTSKDRGSKSIEKHSDHRQEHRSDSASHRRHRDGPSRSRSRSPKVSKHKHKSSEHRHRDKHDRHHHHKSHKSHRHSSKDDRH